MTGPGGQTGVAGVRLRWGGASHVGQVRQVNQDSLFVGTGLFVVADGMGGHAGGEIASRIAVETMEAELETGGEQGPPRRVLDLVTAVQAANDRVWAQSEDDPNLAGMGTTVVAIGIVEEAGEVRVAIVNVGDSRAYRFSGGNLDQISDDHSLVGELYREGRLTADEARAHPQKNIVTRAVGIDRYVDVDEFQVLPRTGDRYLLCSDGLTDELTEDDIATVLRTVDDPEAAAADLVRQANEAGGRDNVTLIVVDVVDDGAGPGGSSDARLDSLPDDDGFSHDPDQDTQSLLAVPDDQAHVHRDRRPEPAPAPVSAPRPVRDPDAPETRAPRAVTLRSLAFVGAVVLLLGGGIFLAYRYAQDTYHVGLDGDQVVIYQGRPGGFLWFDATAVEDAGIDVDDVPPAVLDDLEAGVTQPSLQRARRYVTNLEDRIEDTRPSVTTTTRPTTTTAPTSTAPPAPTPTTAAVGG